MAFCRFGRDHGAADAAEGVKHDPAAGGHIEDRLLQHRDALWSRMIPEQFRPLVRCSGHAVEMPCRGAVAPVLAELHEVAVRRVAIAEVDDLLGLRPEQASLPRLALDPGAHRPWPAEDHRPGPQQFEQKMI